MRDNVHDDMFTDHAWLEMHKTLDREMPERKRRGFLFWLLPALGLCLLFGRDTLTGRNVRAVSKTPGQETKAIASKGQSEKNNLSIQQLRVNPEKNSAPPLEKPAIKNAPFATRIQQKKELTLQRQLSVKTSEEKRLKFAHSTQGKRETQIGNTTVPTSSFPPLSSETNPLENHLKTIQADEPVETLENEQFNPGEERLATVDLMPNRAFNLDLPAPLPEAPGLNAKKRKQRMEWWAEASTQITQGLPGISGYRVGAMAALPMGRLRLRMGMEYENTEVDFKSIQRDAAGRESIGGVKVVDPAQLSLGASANNNTQTVSSIQLQFIHLSLSMYHPLGKRFGAGLGGSLLYLEGIKLGNQYLKGPFFDASNGTYDLAFGNGLTVQQSSSISKADFRSLGFAAQAEFSYRISPRWSTSLGYRYSLQHYTKSADLLLKPNWVDVGLRYRIR